LESLNNLDYSKPLVEIIVVDNGSTDESLKFVQETQPNIKLIRNPLNYGFARASNQGAEAAGGEWLAFINNDMRLEPDWAQRLLEALSQRGEDVVCAGSKILSWDGGRVDFIGGSMAFNGHAFQRHFGEPVEAVEQPREVQETLFACGGAMLIRRDVFLQVGGFDEDYFAYFEDVDLGWRLWLMGYRVILVPQAVVYHHHFGTTRKLAASKHLFLCERNALFSIYKNYSDDHLQQVLPAALMLLVGRFFLHSAFDPSALQKKVQPSPPKREQALEIRPQTAALIFHLLGDVGIKATIDRAALSLAIKELHKCGMQPVSEKGLAILSAVPAFAGIWDELIKKRAFVQERRKRDDAELFPLFQNPLCLFPDTPTHKMVFENVTSLFKIRDIFKK